MKKLLILLLLLFTTDSFGSGMGNVSSAPCDNDTLNKYTGTANVEINWEPNTINLNWYDGDTKLTVANNSQTCVYDGTLTVPTQPTKPGYTFNGWKVIRVPGGFTELEYIEATGTQAIDTNYVFTNPNSEVIIKFMITAWWFESGQSAACLAGAENNLRGWKFIPVIRYGRDSTCVLNDSDIEENLCATTEVNSTHVIKMKQQNNIFTMDFDGQIQSRTNNVNENTNTTYSLFADKYDTGEYTHKIKARIYYAHIYSGDIMVRNMIPARRNSDNVLGMYDSISGQFFTNVGTGVFIAGPVVQ